MLWASKPHAETSLQPYLCLKALGIVKWKMAPFDVINFWAKM